MRASSESLLEVRDLAVEFRATRGVVHALRHVDLSVPRNKVVGIVGESGCGKSVTSLGIMGLIPTPPGRYAGGQVLFEGRDLLTMPAGNIRGARCIS